MTFFAVFLLAVALSMDAFAVAVASGCALQKPKPRHYVRLSAAFGFFQFAMPVIGWYLGLSVREYMEAWDHWIAFVLLGWIGGKMVLSGLRVLKQSESCACPTVDPTAGGNLLVLSVATSIDALAVGLSLALLGTPIWGEAALIGIICAVITAGGVFLGKTLANFCALNGWAELVGGLTLLLIACNILREHQVF
ncbi:MAG: manganese efflux pump MntP family protein [Desulfovibrio sp.]|nr:manganese efflux pump MntP family protein [Desulfovibrio sp.]